MEKQAACAAPRSSSGLVCPFGSALRAGHETLKVPTPEDTKETVPDPSSKFPFQIAAAFLVVVIEILFVEVRIYQLKRILLSLMCSYCGCQSLPVIRLLTLQHEEVINKLGEVRRAFEIGDDGKCQIHAQELALLLVIHNKLEEDGLFEALDPNEEFGESLEKLRLEHDEIDALVSRIIAGEVALSVELEILLRNNISNEENGLFPASAVTLDGSVWDKIEASQGVAR